MSDNDDMPFPAPAMRAPVRGARPPAQDLNLHDDGCALEALHSTIALHPPKAFAACTMHQYLCKTTTMPRCCLQGLPASRMSRERV